MRQDPRTSHQIADSSIMVPKSKKNTGFVFTSNPSFLLLAILLTIITMSDSATASTQQPIIRRGICVLRGTGARDGLLKGVIRFRQNDTSPGISVDVDILGMGIDETHGIHIHQYGDVSDQLKGLNNGAHFAVGHMSDGARHGRPFDQDPRPHNGDLGNVVADSQGRVKTSLNPDVNPWATLDGNEYSVIGRALVIHEKKDTGDRSTETGNAGGRFGQCTIGLEGLDDNQENAALAAPIPSGSFGSCTLNPLPDSPFSKIPVRGELRFETTTMGFVNITGLISGLSPTSSYAFVIHRDGNIQQAGTLGPEWDPDGSTKPGSSRLPKITPNCRGISEYRAYIDGLQFPLTSILGRSLAVHAIDPIDSTQQLLGPVLSACVVGLAAPTKAVPIVRHNVIPRADCVLQPTHAFSTVSGRITINSTDEYDCSVSAFITLTGVPFTHTSAQTTNILSFHTNGDTLDKTSASRVGPLFVSQKLPPLITVNGSFTGNLYPPKDQTFNSLLSLSDTRSIIGRSITISLDNTKDSSNPSYVLAQCVVGLADTFSSDPAEISQNLPNTRIGQPDSAVTESVASMSPTYFFPSVEGQIWFRLRNYTSNIGTSTNNGPNPLAVEVELALLGNPLTNYTIRIYSHGSIRTRVASNFGENNLLYTVLSQEKDAQGNQVIDYRFISDKNGIIRKTVFPLFDSQGSLVTLASLLGKAVLVQPVYEDAVLSANGFGVIGIADKAGFPAPNPPVTQIYDNESSEDITPLAAGLGAAAGVAVIIAVVFGIRYHKKNKVIAMKEKHLLMLINISDLDFGKLLGKGGFGEVFAGKWRGADVAIKKIMASNLTREILQEFESEIGIMMELRHPNIVLYMAACVDPKSLCIVSELMNRGSLYNVLHDEFIEMDLPLKISILADAAKGLQYLHLSTPPILHRDLKSPNLLLDDKWNCKISDFGLTGIHKVRGENELPPGTLFWMAPEVIQGKDYKSAADVYSLAIIMWETFTRLEPYEGEIAESVAFRVLNQGYRPNMPSSDIMPPNLKSLMQECWDQSLDARPNISRIAIEITNVYLEKGSSNSFSFGSSMAKTSLQSKKDNAPIGKLALVFTDVQGSTSLWENYPDEMSQALVTHNDIIRGLLVRNKGYEVKTEGDAFMASFSTVKSALSFALQTQEMLISADWPENILTHNHASQVVVDGVVLFKGLRVRMGIHFGEPICKQDPVTGRMDYFGQVVNKAARVGGYPQGGQIALSESAYEEVKGELESLGSPIVRDLGEKELKGISATTRIYEVIPMTLSQRSNVFMQREMGDSNGASTTQSIGSTTQGQSWQLDYDSISISANELGAGSFGVVYLGELRGERVAVKKFMKQKMDEKRYFSFLSEIMLLKEAKHSNILRFHGASVKSPNICLVIEYAEHGSLKDVLSNPKIQLTDGQRKDILLQCADALRYLHERTPPIIHRDLKSANVMVCALNPILVKIGDFGLARVKADNQTMTKCGTRAWLAPEVLKGLRYGEKADVFSYGIMIWEVLSREKPYADKDPLRLNMEIVNGLRPTIPRGANQELAKLMTQCWDTDETIRPSFSTIYDQLLGRA